jgi:hypothetical protein
MDDFRTALRALRATRLQQEVLFIVRGFLRDFLQLLIERRVGYVRDQPGAVLQRFKNVPVGGVGRLCQVRLDLGRTHTLVSSILPLHVPR